MTTENTSTAGPVTGPPEAAEAAEAPGPGVPDLLAVLDAVDNLPESVEMRRRTYGLLGLGAGMSVVDVGCGAGRAAGEMASLVAERGSVLGVDLNEDMVAAARARWPEADFRVGDARALPLEGSSLDAYRAEKVLHDLPDPAAALAEAYRVLAPGGRIVLLGQDWDGWVVDSANRDLTLRILRSWSDTIPSPDSARGFRRLLREAGFADVASEARCVQFTDRAFMPAVVGAAGAAEASGAADPDDVRMWLTEQQERMDSGGFLALAPFVVASARKP
ncbi:methyltransferase domain-containing protein [Streptomonospora sp. PA3]|uniref:methyltransferase domain-containing protein n=1 Tax=Streptomonospora sp. PA3 TaxID=2607326 RepID=UPI0012DD6724|nr:methyltransferase domain-containing protein [Streptomonospora sp. PA3]MUL42438.1 methyltransferase domain-containing protein [Streptomonospora sp. PA3]